MTELVGAVGLAQLGKVKAVVEKRRELGEHLTSLLRGLTGSSPRRLPRAPGPPTGNIRSTSMVVCRRSLRDRDDPAEDLGPGRLYRQADLPLLRVAGCEADIRRSREWPFNCNPGITYEYQGRAVPARRSQPDAGRDCIPIDESRDRDYVERIAAAVSSTMKTLAAGTVPAVAGAQRHPGEPAQTAAGQSSEPEGSRSRSSAAGRWGAGISTAYTANPRVEVVGFVDTCHRSRRAFRA